MLPIYTSIKERCASYLRAFNGPLFSRAIPIILSVWILSLTAYYCFNSPWFRFLSDGWPDTKELIAETLKFHWVPVFLSRLPYVFYILILNFIALLMGNRILRWLKVDFDSNLNKIVFSIPLGWGIYSIGIFYLGILGLLYKEAVYCFLTLLGILSILEIRRIYNITSPQSPPSQGGDKGEVIDNNNSLSRFKIDKTDLVFLPVIIIFIAVQLVISFGPIADIVDVVIYHMALPKLYIRHHALVHVPGFFFSTLPAHTEMLYLLGLITSGETLSKLFSFSISSLFLISIFSIGTKYFSKGVGYLAAIIMTMSVLSFSGLFSEPFVDAALGLFSLLGIYAFFMWIEERKDGYLYLSIANCALAAATKIQGLFFVPLFFIGFLVTVKMDRHFLKKLAWCILAVGIIALPWYIRSWWLTGDPIFPVLYKYLGASASGGWNEYSNKCFWEFLSIWGGVKSFYDFIRINKDLFLGGFVVSPLSPIVGIFLIPALIMFSNWNKLTRYLFFITLAYYMFLMFTSPQMRFFYVGLAILSIIAAHFIKTIWTKYLPTRIPILCIAIFSIVSFSSFHSGIGKAPFFAGLGVLNRRQFFNESTHRRAFKWVNENLPQDSKILSWLMNGYYLDREYVLANPALQGVLDFGKINDAPTFLKSIKNIGITHLLYQPYGSGEWLRRRPKEFLDKCISELLEEGRIAPLKQIDSCAIYLVAVPLDYFVLDGNAIKFNDESHRKHLATGWSSTEEWGTWSEGKESVILVNFTPTLPSPSPYPSPQWGEDGGEGEDIGGGKDYIMLIKATGFSVPGKQQSVKIYLDDNLLGEHTFTQPTTYFEDIEVKIPSVYIKEGTQRIKFVYSFTGSPAEHGMGSDARQLAMGVSSIEFK